MTDEARQIVEQFAIEGRLLSIEPYGSGHINHTYASTIETPQGWRRYIHQRINGQVFRDPLKLMDNVGRVLAHLHDKISKAGGDPTREAMTLVPAKDGKNCLVDADGDVWRTYLFVEKTRSYDVVTDPRQAYQAGKAFGGFINQLADLPGPPLNDTIVNFHNAVWRFENFKKALQDDVVSRAEDCREEIDFVLQREELAGTYVNLIEAGKLPLRITHNDTKINNVLFDEITDNALCVIDLDTVMPGAVGYDFGDSVRLGASTGEEDEKDLSKICFDLERFEQLAKGFLEEMRDTLTEEEIRQLPIASRLMTFTIGLRFITDHLADDVYFRIHRENHNLDRARTQFKLVADMEAQADAIEEIIQKYAGA